jgi:hypothetical protein
MTSSSYLSKVESFICFCLSLLLLGCKQNFNEFEQLIISDKNHTKVWNYYFSLNTEDDSYEYIGYKFLFLSDEVKVFHSEKLDERGRDYTDFSLHTDEFSKREWFYDSTNQKLNLDRDSFIIERYNSDTIFMKGDGFEGEFIMVKMIKKNK